MMLHKGKVHRTTDAENEALDAILDRQVREVLTEEEMDDVSIYWSCPYSKARLCVNRTKTSMYSITPDGLSEGQLKAVAARVKNVREKNAQEVADRKARARARDRADKRWEAFCDYAEKADIPATYNEPGQYMKLKVSRDEAEMIVDLLADKMPNVGRKRTNKA